MPYQREDLDKILQRLEKRGKIRSLVAWQMGLGKSILSYALAVKTDIRPVVIVCPAYLKLQWQREGWEKFRLRTMILSTERMPSYYDRTKMRSEYSVYIINYEILGPWMEFLKSLKPQLVVIDECQNISNLNALRTTCVRELCERVPNILPLSGTPLTNRPWEIYSVCNLLWPKRFDSPFSFGMKFCDADRDYGKWNFTGAKNLRRLHKILTSCGMIRRTKDECLKDLPPIQRFVVPLEISKPEEYAAAEKDLIRWLASYDIAKAKRAARAERWVKMGYLKRLAAKLKMPAVYKWIANFLEASDGKLLVGAIHRKEEPIIPRLYNKFEKCAVVIDGSRSTKQREEATDRFQNDRSIRVLIGQMSACGLGLNLTAASAVMHAELGWHAILHQQFTARAHRIGQKGSVLEYYLVAAGTIEEKLCQMIQKKSGLSDQVLDGKDSKAGSLAIFDELTVHLLERTGGKR